MSITFNEILWRADVLALAEKALGRDHVLYDELHADPSHWNYERIVQDITRIRDTYPDLAHEASTLLDARS